MSAKRLPLAIALLLTPDSRHRTRMAIMRVATLHERTGFSALSPACRKRLLRGMPPAQKTWVSVGASLYGIASTRPLVLPLFVVALLYFAARVVALAINAF